MQQTNEKKTRRRNKNYWKRTTETSLWTWAREFIVFLFDLLVVVVVVVRREVTKNWKKKSNNQLRINQFDADGIADCLLFSRETWGFSRNSEQKNTPLPLEHSRKTKSFLTSFGVQKVHKHISQQQQHTHTTIRWLDTCTYRPLLLSLLLRS